MTLTVNPVTDLTVTDESFSTNEDTVLNADVSTNDSTTSGGSLSYALDTDVSNGTLVLNANGSFSYTPDANYTGGDSFVYTVTDADSGESSTGTVTLTVNPVNDLPVGMPTISGTPNFGSILTVDDSAIQDTDGLGTFSYQWLRDGVAISGATNNSYTLAGADTGARISVMVHYMDGGGTAETIISTQTGPVSGPDESVNEPQVTDSNSDNGSGEEQQLPVESEDEQAEEDPIVEAASDAAQTSGTPVADFDFAAMAGEIQPIGTAESLESATDHNRGRDFSAPDSGTGSLIQPKWIDLKNLDMKVYEMEGLTQIEIPSVMDNAGFVQGLETVKHDLDDAAKRSDANYRLGTEAAVGVTLSLSAGFVSWVLRTGSLMASFMSVVPMWKQLDPLPILGAAIVKGKKKVGFKSDKEEQDREVEDIFDQEDPR